MRKYQDDAQAFDSIGINRAISHFPSWLSVSAGLSVDGGDNALCLSARVHKGIFEVSLTQNMNCCSKLTLSRTMEAEYEIIRGIK